MPLVLFFYNIILERDIVRIKIYTALLINLLYHINYVLNVATFMFDCKINELFKIFMCIKGKNTFCRSIWHPYLSNQEAFSFGNIFSGNQMSP